MNAQVYNLYTMHKYTYNMHTNTHTQFFWVILHILVFELFIIFEYVNLGMDNREKIENFITY